MAAFIFGMLTAAALLAAFVQWGESPTRKGGPVPTHPAARTSPNHPVWKTGIPYIDDDESTSVRLLGEHPPTPLWDMPNE